MKLFLFILFLNCLCQFTKAQNKNAENLRLNQVQIIASHNSYKKRPGEKEFHFLMKKRKMLGKENDPIQLDYEHLPFDSQFTGYQVRGLEIDIYNDPDGGLFYRRKINAFIHGLKQKSGIEGLKKPGMKVLHIKDVDYETNYYTFKQALSALKKWSDEHPTHLPLFINIESKNEGPGDASALLRLVGFKRAAPFDVSACDSIDAEIKSVFGDDLKNIITPDRMRGNFSTPEEMVLRNGWLTLNECRGKIVFIMEGGAVPNYLMNHEALKGRVVFVYSEPGKAEAAFVKRNDSTRDKLKIQDLVKRGYIVRTRSDAETWQSRNNDYTNLNNALESGAQIISTDYYKADTRFSNYHVQFEHHEPGRSNPINSDGRSLGE